MRPREGAVMASGSVGSRDCCPLCETALAAAACEPIAQGRCPRCEAELWTLAFPSGPAFFVRRPGDSASKFIAVLAGERLRASEADIASFLRAADSLDMVEFMAELEENASGVP